MNISKRLVDLARKLALEWISIVKKSSQNVFKIAKYLEIYKLAKIASASASPVIINYNTILSIIIQ